MAKQAKIRHQLPAWTLVLTMLTLGSGLTWDTFDWTQCAGGGWNSGLSTGPNCGVNTWDNSGINWGLNHGDNSGINLNYNSGDNEGINVGTNQGVNYGINLGWNRGINNEVNDGYNGPQLRCGLKCFNQW